MRRKINQSLIHQGKRVPRKIHESLLHQGKRVLRTIHQSLLHKGKKVLKKIYQRPSPKKGCFVDETNRTSQANSDSYKKIRMQKKVHVTKQGALKRKMLECVKVGEKVILRIQTKN